MGAIEDLAACVGPWQGTNRLHDPNTGVPEDSECTASMHAVLGGLFLRFDYRWAYDGKLQEGSLLIGRQTRVGTVRACWIDTWHMGDQFMMLGGGEVNDKLSVVGAYPAPPGPDWGWRIELVPEGDRRLLMSMMNITPDGEEQPAVDATLERC